MIMFAHSLSLEDLNSKLIEKQIRMPEITVCILIYTMAHQLININKSGLNHSDVKPANILLSTYGYFDSFFLADFGISYTILVKFGLIFEKNRYLIISSI